MGVNVDVSPEQNAVFEQSARRTGWHLPPANLSLSNGEVHVWHASLDLTPSKVEKLYKTLSADERARADRFYFQRGSHRFIVARATLRAILSNYIHAPPSELSFSYGAHGKPSLVSLGSCPTPSFNLAHASGHALYSVAYDMHVGIDIEQVRSDLDCMRLAARFFSAKEQEHLRGLSSDERQHAFFNIWVRKEAYIKATGDGLTFPLDEFDVPLAPPESPQLMRVRHNREDVDSFYLRTLNPLPGYAAAVVTDRPVRRLRRWRWSISGETN